ncbi:glutathione S-transferase family protein [Aestuariivirga sp.]|jgi:glutathione S-transferase|uniref:glutathione S-transferase family protein n=1 Tax=Aestuariivirga sp. TaxID=2650926 RepID=UPI00378367A7
MYTLYNVKAWGSLVVDCLLAELDARYTIVWMTAEQVKTPEFRKLNPLGLIPALGLADGRTLYESAAIVSYLVAAHPEKRMSPPLGSGAYGEFMSVLHLMSTELYPTISLCFSGSGYAETPEHEAFLTARARERSDGYWRILEQRMSAAGPWLMGQDFSALDLYAFMLSVWGRPSEQEFNHRFPAVAKLASQVRARPRLQPVLQAHGVMSLGGYGS